MKQPLSVLAILDPYETSAARYDFHKDSSHLLLKALSKRGHSIFYADPGGLFAQAGRVCVRAREVEVVDGPAYFVFQETQTFPADAFGLILMRKDPPVDLSYLYTTQLLSLVSPKALVVNNPQALREWNEKLVILNFPHLIPRTMVAASRQEIESFIRNLKSPFVIKSLDGYAGKGVRRFDAGDLGWTALHTQWTRDSIKPVMVQEFLPQVHKGEKRVFMVDGEPLGALLKTPAPKEFLTNPDRGAALASTTLTANETTLCLEVGAFLKKQNIFFAGIDLIGEKLIEINITSPGLIHEWNEVDQASHEEKIIKSLIDRLEKKLSSS